MTEDPFEVGRPNRDSHTVRLAYKRDEPPREGGFRRWFVRGVAALIVFAAVTWFALPAPVKRQFPERVPVHFWHQWAGERRAKIEEVVAAFNRSQERYEVISLSVPGTISDQKFLLAIAGGDPPDVMTQYNPTLGPWAADGLLQPLEGMLTEEDLRVLREDAFPIALKAAQCQGHLYGIPIGVNTYVCFYRVDLLRAAGLEPDRLPSSLEELVEWGRKLDRIDARGQLERIGFLPSRLAIYAPLFSGGFAEGTDGALTIDTEGNRRALAFIADAYKHYGYERLVQFRSSLNTGSAAVEWPFISGQYPITVDGQFRIEQLERYAPEVEYITAPIPPPKDGRARAGFGSVNLALIPVGAKEPQGAMAFIRYWSGLLDPHIAGSFNAASVWMPPLRTAIESPSYQDYLARNPQLQTFVTAIDSPHVEPLPPIPSQTYFNIRMWRAEDSVVRGNKSVEQALKDLVAEMKREQTRRGRFARAGSEP